MSNTGDARIICGENGERLTPMFVPRGGYSNGDHAVFVVARGMHIVLAAHGRWGEEASVERITRIDDGDAIHTEKIGSYSNGDGNIPAAFDDAVAAALGKAKEYHCRMAWYIKMNRDR